MKIFTVKRNSQGEYEVHVDEELVNLVVKMVKAGQKAAWEGEEKKPE